VGAEFFRIASDSGRIHPQQVGATRQRFGHASGRLTHAPAQRVAHHGIAAVLPNCVSDLRVYTFDHGVYRYETGPDRTKTRPRPRTLESAEHRPGLDSSNRPGGHDSSDGETVAPLEPPRLQDGPSGPGGHALAKAVGLGSLPGVGLIGALHVVQPFARRSASVAGASQSSYDHLVWGQW
jgi:hypothetical protein